MKKPIAILRYLLSVHLLALIILTTLRIFLLGSNIEQISEVEKPISLILTALLKGVQFDNVIGCYILSLPTVVLYLLSLINKTPKLLIKISNIYFIILYTLVFAISTADIPYFSYYYTHLNNSIFNWIGFGGTLGMVFQETSYYFYFGLFALLVILFAITVLHFGKKLENTETKNIKISDYKYYIPLFLLIGGTFFVSIRGLGRYPFRVSDAYFCENSFINQLGVNPSFFLYKSITSASKKKDKLKGLDIGDKAVGYVQKRLAISNPLSEESPISRTVQFDSEGKRHNIVIVLMESMSSEYLNMAYQGKSLTPYLHDLIDRSYYFENFYSAGIHTNNGIVSTLYGFPPIFEQTMMPATPDYYSGLPMALKEIGYKNYFFLSHDPSYDNMYAFLNENGFDHIYSELDYPSDKIVNNFGVQDDFLFDYSINKLNEIAKEDKPFLATIMTISNHPPYVVPNAYKNAGNSDDERIVAFADNSLKEFMEEAEKQDWYNNTIFVILGDHGRILGKQTYEMSLTYNHVPLILYSPLFDDSPKLIKDFGGQIDIFPTIMGLLQQPYVNNSLGIDLFKEKRPYTYFVSDNHLGCVNDEFFYIFNPDNKVEGLFKYRDNNTENLMQKNHETAKDMKEYAISMMVTANYLIQNKLTQ